MNHSNNLLKLALATTLLSSTAFAASGDTVTLRALEDDLVSGRAGEIYAELDTENYLPYPTNNPGRATVQLSNQSGTPYVAYDVTLRIRCTGGGTAQSKSGTLSSSGSGTALTVRCGEGNIITATATITRR